METFWAKEEAEAGNEVKPWSTSGAEKSHFGFGAHNKREKKFKLGS